MAGTMHARAFVAMLVAIAATLGLAALVAPEISASALAFAGATALVFSLALTLAFARSVSRPVAELAETADRLATGDLRVRVRSRRNDEIGSLGRAIDRMADQLDVRLGAAQREEVRLRAILEAMVEAVLVTDAEGRIVLSNAAFAPLAGEAPLGRTVIEAVRSPELHEAVRDAIGGKERRVSVTVSADSKTRILDAAVSPLPASTGVVVVLHDVTELRRTDAVRRDFVANASHELRTPLTSIKGFAETLEGGALGEPAVARRFVHGIVENANRLQRLVDDLVELSRAESPDATIELGPVAVAEVAAKVMRALEPRAKARRIQLSLEPGGRDAVALGDERALDQVLMNLVENAIKYTPEGGHVWVRASVEDQTVVLAVKDDGPGIAEQHLPRLFERFYRVDQGRAREQGGTGLGLAIVKHLAGRMRGEVSVASRVGKGTTFTVRLARSIEERPSGP